MLQRFEAIFYLYKPFFLWSAGITIVLVALEAHSLQIIVTKLFLTLALWYFMKETTAKRKLIFYKNLGLSNIKVFSSLFLMDFIFTIPFTVLIPLFL